MPRKRKTIHPPWHDRRYHFKQKVIRFVVHVFALIGMAVLYYVAFSIFFDTPTEYRLKRSAALLDEQYGALNQRFDSLNKVLENVVERDRNVFRTVFEAEPYDFDEGYKARLTFYENLLGMTNKQLGKMFVDEDMRRFEGDMSTLMETDKRLEAKIASIGDAINYIPAIQPVINPDLTLLTASYGMRIQPFEKHLTSHQGVDYTVPEGSRVFATADGTVIEATERSASTGKTIIIDHGNGYQTEYRHLSRIDVKKGQKVRRGDIIGLSGNTGLSFAPHLHYEIQYKGMRVDPIHYFFMELTPDQYQKIMRIAQSGMQSFD